MHCVTCMKGFSNISWLILYSFRVTSIADHLNVGFALIHKEVNLSKSPSYLLFCTNIKKQIVKFRVLFCTFMNFNLYHFLHLNLLLHLIVKLNFHRKVQDFFMMGWSHIMNTKLHFHFLNTKYYKLQTAPYENDRF